MDGRYFPVVFAPARDGVPLSRGYPFIDSLPDLWSTPFFLRHSAILSPSIRVRLDALQFFVGQTHQQHLASPKRTKLTKVRSVEYPAPPFREKVSISHDCPLTLEVFQGNQ